MYYEINLESPRIENVFNVVSKRKFKRGEGLEGKYAGEFIALKDSHFFDECDWFGKSFLLAFSKFIFFNQIRSNLWSFI